MKHPPLHFQIEGTIADTTLMRQVDKALQVDRSIRYHALDKRSLNWEPLAEEPVRIPYSLNLFPSILVVPQHSPMFLYSPSDALHHRGDPPWASRDDIVAYHRFDSVGDVEALCQVYPQLHRGSGIACVLAQIIAATTTPMIPT